MVTKAFEYHGDLLQNSIARDLEEGQDMQHVRINLPRGVQELSVLVASKTPVRPKRKLLSLSLSNANDIDLDIPKWPIYPRTGKRSKFFRETTVPTVHNFASLVVPADCSCELDVRVDSIGSAGRDKWLLVLTGAMPDGAGYEFVTELIG